MCPVRVICALRCRCPAPMPLAPASFPLLCNTRSWGGRCAGRRRVLCHLTCVCASPVTACALFVFGVPPACARLASGSCVSPPCHQHALFHSTANSNTRPHRHRRQHERDCAPCRRAGPQRRHDTDARRPPARHARTWHRVHAGSGCRDSRGGLRRSCLLRRRLPGAGAGRRGSRNVRHHAVVIDIDIDVNAAAMQGVHLHSGSVVERVWCSR